MSLQNKVNYVDNVISVANMHKIISEKMKIVNSLHISLEREFQLTKSHLFVKTIRVSWQKKKKKKKKISKYSSRNHNSCKTIAHTKILPQRFVLHSSAYSEPY